MVSCLMNPHRSFPIRVYMELRLFAIILLCFLWSPLSVLGVRFTIDREECFSQHVPYEGDTVQVSFVVIKIESWQFSDNGVDLVIMGPRGDQIRDSRGKLSDIFDFTVQQMGVHRFCFINKSPYHETIDFDVHVAHFAYKPDPVKDEHLEPIIQQIEKLQIALYNIHFEQHWLEAQNDRHLLLNEAMAKRAVMKAVFESVALVAVSTLQVYLLRRLFNRKLGHIRA